MGSDSFVNPLNFDVSFFCSVVVGVPIDFFMFGWDYAPLRRL